MRAGRLRHRLILQSKVVGRDSYGGAIITWTTQATVWGAIEPLSGNEYFAQDQIQSESKVRVVIRYHSTVDPEWRISHAGLYYDIQDVLNHDTRNRQITLMCKQGVKEDEA
ncbi:phage head closure protein [bacterium]|nr:phage head closure protein [bacterium]